MGGKNTAVFGIYANQSDVRNAADRLMLTGFRETDVSILYPENAGTKDLALEKNTKAPEGAVLGAVCGVVAGGVLGWLVGSGLFAIPGLELFAAAGPILGSLGGIAAGGVLFGVIGALIGLNSPEYVARRFEGRVRMGGILLSVHCDDRGWVGIAKTVLDQTGAQDVASAREARADYASGERPGPRTITSPTAKAS